MRLSLVQSSIVWEKPSVNLEHFEKKLNPLKGQTDIVVLPEMFTTGFSMSPKQNAEPSGGAGFQWMQKMASMLDAAVTGSIAVEDGGKYYNRLFWVFPDGSSAQYDKRHLFSYAKEQEHYTKGEQRLIIEWRDWTICPLVCYDLRFPVWSRNVDDYDLLIYMANWPAPRISHWDALLKARAIENLAYTAGVNIVGKDGNDYDYIGHSQVIDFAGKQQIFSAETETVLTIQLSKTALHTYRKRFNFLADRDNYQIL